MQLQKPKLKSVCPLIKESPISYFNQQVFFPPIYSSINDIPNKKSKIITIIVEYSILGKKYFDTGH